MWYRLHIPDNFQLKKRDDSVATIREVARVAHVSVATVSRVLNASGYVKAETEKKIRRAMEELNYSPSAVARGLAGKSMATIALMLPDITNPFFPQLAQAVEDACQEQGFSLLLCNAGTSQARQAAYEGLLRRRNVDGILFAELADSDGEWLQADGAVAPAGVVREPAQADGAVGPTDVLHEPANSADEPLAKAIPIVVLDRAPESLKGVEGGLHVVRAGNYAGAVTAVRHLLERGCRRIGHLSGPAHIATARNRMEAYKHTVSEYNWYMPSLIAPGDFTVAGGLAATEELMERHPDIDGIFAGNDLMAIGALKALQRRGLAVPGQVAICGFDGIPFAEMAEPELTTVAQPIAEMGKLAAQLLISLITGAALEKLPAVPAENSGLFTRYGNVYELQTSLIVRASSAGNAN